MIAGISKKVILNSFLFINLLQPSKSADLEKINRSENNLDTEISHFEISNIKYLPNNSNPLFRKNFLFS